MARTPGLRHRCTGTVASTLLLGLALGAGGPARADDDTTWARKIDGVPQTRYTTPAGVIAHDRALARELADEIDPVVGRIGVRTVRASALLDARCEAKLRRLAATCDRDRFRSAARRVILMELRRLVEDELVYQDALAAFTEEQRGQEAGWLRETLDDLITEHGGGDPIAADERLRARDGRGLIEELGSIRRQALVSIRIREIMGDRLSIEDEEIERVYERTRARYLTPASRRVRMIRTSDPDAAARIDAALAAGRSFAEVAGTAGNVFRPADGGALPDPVIGDDGLRAPLDAALLKLRPGEHSPRLEHGAGFAWIALEEMTPEQLVPLADARDEIEREIYSKRYSVLMTDYIEELMARDGVQSSCEEITTKTLRVALARYAPVRSVARPTPLMPPPAPAPLAPGAPGTGPIAPG